MKPLYPVCPASHRGTQRVEPLHEPNAEHVARKLLREKHGKHSSFYAPIRYPTSYH